jgi:hypothetical protein
MRTLLTIMALLVAFPTWAAPGDVTDRWAMRSSGRIVMTLDLTHGATGWHGRWRRPKHFETDATFSTIRNVEGPAIEKIVSSATQKPDGLHLVFGTSGGKGREEMVFRELSDGTARLIWPGTTDAGLVFDPARPNETPIDYVKGDVYAIDQHWATNAEMTAIFDADQADRSSAAIDWSLVGPRDSARAARTKTLLDNGALASADDYYHAAFVFQHGAEPNDYLLAHTLAMIAVARGRADASWIAAATLDRYLQRIGQKQIFGTQFVLGKSDTTQDPYDRQLLSDAIRKAVGVPPIAAQEQRRKAIEAGRSKK